MTLSKLFILSSFCSLLSALLITLISLSFLQQCIGSKLLLHWVDTSISIFIYKVPTCKPKSQLFCWFLVQPFSASEDILAHLLLQQSQLHVQQAEVEEGVAKGIFSIEVVINFIQTYLHQFFNNFYSLNSSRKPLRRSFYKYQSCLKAINISQDIRQISRQLPQYHILNC